GLTTSGSFYTTTIWLLELYPVKIVKTFQGHLHLGVCIRNAQIICSIVRYIFFILLLDCG
ncbi:MAG: hypothetical protein MJA30_13145, partial [Cytophagales bacterium]|nr:hypothetical protein [Cytophagales bacterium]